jgi:hypothetical protein
MFINNFSVNLHYKKYYKMFGLFKKKSEKEKLTDLYKKIKEQAYVLSKTNRKESDKLEKEANDILEKIDIIDENNTSLEQ